VNQLYQNTLNYIVNDVPVAPQAYPVGSFSYSFNGVTYTEKPVDYAGQLGKNIPASTNGAQGPTPLSLVPVVANGTWTPAAVLYQFSGLKDAAACYSNMQSYNQTAGTAGTLQDWLQSNPAACPAIFTLADGTPLSYTCDTSDPSQCTGSVYDGNTLQPYTSYQAVTGTTGGPIQLTAPVPNNLKFCDPTSPALEWEPQRAGPVLNCGQWYAPQYLAAGFPRANVPAGNSEQFFYTDQTPVGGYGSTTRLGGDCSDNLTSPIGNRYPAMTTLTGSWPSGAPSSCAVIPSVALVGTGNLQSPRYTGSRTESVNYETGNASQGCSIGWIGSGLGNPLPHYDDYGQGGDELDFGLRLPRAVNGANETGGFVLPLKATAGCVPRESYGRVIAAPPVGDLAAYGYQCAAIDGATRFTCTITDGTVYNFTVSIGRSSILDVRTVTP
jgi:hypothetical protein